VDQLRTDAGNKLTGETGSRGVAALC